MGELEMQFAQRLGLAPLLELGQAALDPSIQLAHDEIGVGGGLDHAATVSSARSGTGSRPRYTASSLSQEGFQA